MSERDSQIVELVGKVEALEHVIVNLIRFLGPDVIRQIVTHIDGNPTPRAVHSLQATNALSETLASIRLDLAGPSVGDHD